MKKFIVLLSVISILFLTGCNKNSNIENNNLSGDNDNYQHQEVINNNQNMEDEQVFENEVNPIDSMEYYQKIIEDRGYNYDAVISPKNVFLNTRIYKLEDNIVLKADIGNPYVFTIEEIQTIVENFENSDDKETKLGAYTIHKEYIEGFYRWFIEDVSLEYDFVDDSFDKNKWYNEEKIPYYITDSYGSFVKFKNIDGLYYPFSCELPVGEIALIDDIKEKSFELILNKDYKMVFCDINGLYEETYTVEELLSDDNIIGDDNLSYTGRSFFNEDAFKIEDAVVYVYTSNGDGI